MPVHRIESADDPRIAGYRNIRERDLVRRQGLFVAEGTVVLRALAAADPQRFGVQSLLVLENRIEGLGDLLATLDPAVPVYVAPGHVMDEIAGFAMHRGVLALGCCFAPPSPEALLASLPEPALVIAGHAISNHDNMGALFRNAAVFGADAALFDSRSCDPLYRKAIRVSVGGVFRVPYARGGDIETIADRLSATGFDLWALSPRGGASIRDLQPGRRTALLVGTEGEGLPKALLERLGTLRIGQAPGMDSLNLATAAAIALHEIAGRMGRLSA